MTRSPGRPAGAPAFDATLRARYLEAVAAGARLGEAAQAVGIHRNLPAHHYRHDPEFARALDEAKTLGKQNRAVRHGETAYNEGRCRCTDICTPAATAARARRRAARRQEDTTPTPAEPEAPPAAPSSPIPFSPRSPLRSPDQRAA
ncbi:PDDEXK family nuclease [Streptomyces hydrogenans]|uniref:hypothetical protein n=1 Tax=Streptomyces hydrogenans TaxID=1873719 RepID=UPI0036E89856